MKAQDKKFKEVTIVLIDDDEVDVMGIHRALKKLKILNTVVRARDGLEGLALLREPTAVSRPYIVLLDINMPRMDGLEMLAELRKDPNLSDSVVFILTTSKTEEDKVKAYAHHVAGYIIKSDVGEGFMSVMEMLGNYWRVVELPLEA